jgi:hypothetical protein
VNLDVASWADAKFARSFTIGGIRIGKMQGAVKEAARVLRVDKVGALGSFLIFGLRLGTFGVAQGDFVGLDGLAIAQQGEGVGGFEDEDAICPMDGAGLREQERRKGEQARERCDYCRFPHIDQMRLRDADFI